MRHLILTAMLPSDDSGTAESDNASLPTLSGGGPLPPRQRPPREESVAECAAEHKRARKCLLRLLRSASSGKQIAEAWEVFRKVGGTLDDLPTGLHIQIQLFEHFHLLFKRS